MGLFRSVFHVLGVICTLADLIAHTSTHTKMHQPSKQDHTTWLFIGFFLIPGCVFTIWWLRLGSYTADGGKLLIFFVIPACFFAIQRLWLVVGRLNQQICCVICSCHAWHANDFPQTNLNNNWGRNNLHWGLMRNNESWNRFRKSYRFLLNSYVFLRFLILPTTRSRNRFGMHWFRTICPEIDTRGWAPGGGHQRWAPGGGHQRGGHQGVGTRGGTRGWAPGGGHPGVGTRG